MTKLNVERVPITSLKPDPDNVRLHDDRNIEAIKASLSTFEQTRPLVVDPDGTIVAGNGTYEAARELGWTHVYVTRVAFASAAELRAFALADNRTAELAQWNSPVLVEAIEHLALAGWSVEELGFEPQDLAAFRPKDAQPPAEFPSYGEDVETEHMCPSCGYEWSGRPE